MSFWSFGVGIWSHSCLIEASSCWRVCGNLSCIFCLMIHQNILYRWNIWTAGRPIQHPDPSTTKPCCLIAAVCGFTLSCWNTQGLPWNRRHLIGSICCSKTFIYLSAFILEPTKTCKPIQYRMHPIPSDMLAFEQDADNTLEVLPPLYFYEECQIWNHLTIEHFSAFKQFILNEPWPTRHNTASGPCSHMASFLHDRDLVGIHRWHGGLCLPTVVSGSVPGPI